MTSQSLRLQGTLLLAFVLAGCSTLGYYGQAVTGHLRLVTAREPIEEVVASADVPEPVREKLETIREIRRFASTSLHLPDNDSYTYYTQLDRPYAVWNVVATPRYSLSPVKWCFPIAGCVSYRGYFERERAERFADGQREKGRDVAVMGATAYSTLGWFADPVLSPMLSYPEPELAGLIFHELAHQRLYLKGDTAFNESFATVVEEEGVRRWLERKGDEAKRGNWLRRRQQQQEFTSLVMDARDRLEVIYDQGEGMERPALDREKQKVFEELRRRYRELSDTWEEDRYGAWMAQDLNNAHLALVSAYHGGVPAFERLLDCAGGDLPRFYSEAERIAEWEEERREEWLDSTERICPGKP